MTSRGQGALRAACDRCHRKKVRCVIQTRRSACDRCLEHRVACVVSPQGQSGRPSLRSRAGTFSAPQRAPSPSRGPDERAILSASGAPALHQGLGSRPSPDPQSSTAAISTDLESLHDALSYPWAGDDLFGDIRLLTPCSSVDPIPADYLYRDAGSETAKIVHNACWNVEPSPLSASDSLRALHLVQQKIHDESRKHTPTWPPDARMPLQQSLDAFQLIDELHSCVHQYFEANAGLGPGAFCDFSAAMALTTALGSVVELYDKVAHCTLITASMGAKSAVRVFAPTAPTCRFNDHSPMHTELAHDREDGTRPSSQPSHPRVDTNMPVQVGHLMLEDAVASRVVAMTLQHQIFISKRLLEQLSRHLLYPSLSPQLSTSDTTSSSSQAGHMADMPTSRHHGHHTPRRLSPDFLSPVTELVYQILQRISKLEHIASKNVRLPGDPM